jgi:hypothetical protein
VHFGALFCGNLGIVNMNNFYSVDTIKVLITNVSDMIIRKIESISQKILRVDVATGGILWEFTTAELSGSYDRSIRLLTHREWWEYDKKAKRPVKVFFAKGTFWGEFHYIRKFFRCFGYF